MKLRIVILLLVLFLSNNTYGQFSLVGDIYFVKAGSIVKMDLASRNESTIYTPSSGGVGYPVLSPDGTKIAFMSNATSSRYQVWIMDADGTDAAMVPTSLDLSLPTAWHGDSLLVTAFEPWGSGGSAWMLNTNTLTYSLFNPNPVSSSYDYASGSFIDSDWAITARSNRTSYDCSLFKVKTDGSQSETLWSSTAGTLYENYPTVSNDKSKVLFTFGSSSSLNLFTYDLNTTNVAQLTTDNGSTNGIWSPDDSFIVFSRGGNIWAREVSTSNEEQITTAGGYGAVKTWSTGVKTDSLALVALYNSTDGANWTDKTNWLAGNSVADWSGVTVTSGRVTMLFLSSINLTGTMPSEIGNLTALETLYLGGNNLIGSIPPEISTLTNLTYLGLDHNSLSGSIPPELGTLTNLVSLDLSYNSLTGSIPLELGNLTKLQSLSLSDISLTGSIPPELGSLTNLTNLWIQSTGVTGSIPPELGTLDSLQTLYLNLNNLSGTIPIELASLVKLKELWLNGNDLSGSIPPELYNLTNLTTFNLNSNSLTGQIPPEIGNMTSLTNLYLFSNQFTGTIPKEIGNLINIQILYLNNNSFIGQIPQEIGNLINMKFLFLNNTGLNGSVPVGFANMSDLIIFEVQDNRFDSLPDLSSLANLTTTKIYNNNFTFEDIEPNVGITGINYSPQDSIGAAKDTSVTIGTNLSLTVSAGGAATQYQWIKNGSNISGATSSTLTIDSLQSSDAGVYICKATNTMATDLTLYTRPVTLSINNHPVIVNIQDQTVNEGDTLNLTVSATDVESDSLFFSISGSKPDGLTLDSTTGDLNWTPSFLQSGDYSLIIKANDIFGGEDADTLDITVLHVNQPPEIDPISDITAGVGEAIITVVTASDIDGDLFKFSLTDGPLEMSIDSLTGEINWKPNISQMDTHRVVVCAEDTLGAASESSFKIFVLEYYATLELNPIGDKNYTEGEKISFDVTSNYDGILSRSYSKSSENLPQSAGASFKSNNDKTLATFKWNTHIGSAGVYQVTFTVKDGYYSDSETITITVVKADFIKGLAASNTKSFKKETGGTISVDTTGFYKKHKVEIPPNALPEDKIIIVQPPNLDDIPLEELENCPSAIDFVVQGSENGFTFEDSVEITIEFKDFEVKSDKSNMRVHEWDKTKQMWKRVRGNHIIDWINNTVRTKTTHFSIYGVAEVSIAEEETTLSPGWGMVSLPVTLDVSTDPVSLFSDDIYPFRYEINNSSIYSYDESAGDWIIPSSVNNGTGYILYAFDPSNIDLDGLVETADITHSLTYTNSNGWHLIGNPFGVDIDWDTDVTLDPLTDNVYYRWTGSEYEFYPDGGLTSTISTWQGFWVHTTMDAEELTISYPGLNKKGVSKPTKPDWRMRIIAQSGYVKDSHNYLGVAENANTGFDGHDIYELSPLNDEFISLYFLNNSTNLTQDIRPNSDEISWDFDVATNSSNDLVSLNWEIPEELESDVNVYMKDNTSGEIIDMRSVNIYSFSKPALQKSGEAAPERVEDPTNFTQKVSADDVTSRNFTITLSKDSNKLVPKSYFLNQNYPNPFNPITKIEYGIPESGLTRIVIFNSLGQKVRTLVNTEVQAGYHSIMWDSRDDLGTEVSTGVYFYRITSGNYFNTMKLLLIR
ncbi:putative Ig domain-containing protein [candidate division KSB1 bacterium]